MMMNVRSILFQILAFFTFVFLKISNNVLDSNRDEWWRNTLVWLYLFFYFWHLITKHTVLWWMMHRWVNLMNQLFNYQGFIFIFYYVLREWIFQLYFCRFKNIFELIYHHFNELHLSMVLSSYKFYWFIDLF